MHAKSKIINVPVQIDEAIIQPQLEKVCEKLGVELPKTASEMENFIATFAKEIFENMQGNMSLNLEWHLQRKLSKGEVARERKIIDEELRNDEFSTLPVSAEWLKKEYNGMFLKYEKRGRRQYEGMDKDAFNKELSRTIKFPHAHRIALSCTRLLQDCYPIELLKEMDMKPSDLGEHALTITQVEKLLKRNGVHKRGEKMEKRKFHKEYPPSCVFPIKRFHNEIHFLRVSFSEYGYRHDYATTPLQGGKSVFPKGSKLFLAFAASDEITH